MLPNNSNKSGLMKSVKTLTVFFTLIVLGMTANCQSLLRTSRVGGSNNQGQPIIKFDSDGDLYLSASSKDNIDVGVFGQSRLFLEAL